MHAFGQTRSVSRRDYLVQTPDTFVRTPLPGLVGGMAVVHAAPEMGARFAMMTVEFADGGMLAPGPAQRFVYVLEGALRVPAEAATELRVLGPQGFAYLPVGSQPSLEAVGRTRVAVIEKPWEPLPDADGAARRPEFFVGTEAALASSALNGDDDVQVRSLMPAADAYDFAVNTMVYAPGASLSQVEVHVMEHGLLMLEGGGIYRLGEAWYPVAAGDFLWMGPFCPQWFGALGKQPAKYLIYKNFNRHVLA